MYGVKYGSQFYMYSREAYKGFLTESILQGLLDCK